MPNAFSLAGFHPTFDAEMTTAADMSQFTNSFINGDRRLYANHEQQYYVDNDPTNPANPFSFGNGALTITASPKPAGDQPYTSGMIETSKSFSQNQGYFEIRAKTTNAQGFWPAFWMITPSYTPEIDVLEQPNNSGVDSKYWANINTPEDYSGGFNETGASLSTGYHTYGFMWDSNSIQFTFDGNYIGYPHATPASLTNAQMYLIANLAVGDSYSWPGAPIPGVSASYSIDYIRAYSMDPAKAAVTMQPISSPDGVDTRPNLGSSAPQSTTPLPFNLGVGPDSFVLKLSEDAYQGDAQFTVSVDGVQQGGVMSASASHAAGQTQDLVISGTFAANLPHTAQINFLNDAYGGANADRNLYVDAASFDGTATSPSKGALFSNGSLSFVRAATVANSDTLTVSMTEDAWQGDARAEISIDGKVLGQVTVTAPNTGAAQAFSFAGDFGGAGAHTIGVNFVNDAYGGSNADRNLHVKGITFDGTAHPSATADMWSGGLVNFGV